MLIDYYCLNCGVKKTNEELDSMVCKCGGDFRPDGMLFSHASTFEPHWCPTTKQYITSWREKEKVGKRHGLVVTPPEHIRQWKKERKQNEDLKQQIFRKDGMSYKPGSKMRWSDKKKDFIKPRADGTYN